MRDILIITIAIIGFISCSNPAQKKEERTEISLDSIKISPNWGDKSVINLKLKKTKTIKSNGIFQSVSSTANIELQLSKNDDNTWNGIWNIKDFQTPQISSPLERKIEKLMNGFVYCFSIDSTGIIYELTNWREIQSKGFEALELVIGEIKNQPTMTPQVIEQMRMNIEELFNSKEKIETYFMQETQLYFALGGIEMTKLDTIAGYTLITNPLTGDLLMQNLSIVYQKAYSDSTCDIQLTQFMDESSFRSFTINTVNKFAGENNTDEFQEKMESVKFDSKITSDYNISLKTGLVEKLSSQKEIIIGDNIRIDKTEITRK